MPAIVSSLLKALRQLSDGAVLKILLKSLLITLAVWAVVALAGWYVLDSLLQWGGLTDSLFAGAGGLRGFVSLLLAAAGLWLSWRLIAMAVIQFFADEVVEAVEQRHYPHAARLARELPLATQLRQSLRGTGRALLVNLIALPFAIALLFTGVGTALLFLLVNAVLLGRELQDMVWLRHAHAPGAPAPIAGSERFLLGGAVAALLMVPFVNFLAPVLGAAAATHLIHRKDRR